MRDPTNVVAGRSGAVRSGSGAGALRSGHAVVASLLALVAALTAPHAQAQEVSAPVPPDAVTIPAGLNLGLTSFYDGFGKFDDGFVFIDYGRYELLNQITGSNGRSSPAFSDPRIQVGVEVLQGVWVAPVHPFGGGAGLDVVLPVINLNSSFSQPGVVLHDNGLGIGDLTFGPFYQAKPIIMGGRPVFSWRTEFDVIAPVGAFDGSKDVNQSSGYWSINPYVAMTVLPTPKTEMTARLWYLYNFQTSKAPDPPAVPEFTFHNGQAGQAAWINFAASYSVTDKMSLGVNGYYLKQFTNDQVDGMSIAGTEKEELYLGPGAHITISPKNILNINAYLPLETKGLATGPQLNVQYIHPF